MAFILWRVIFAWLIFATILSEYGVETSTRWQPSIIWDRFNPLLICRCNWMKIPTLAIYDRVELLCPKTYLVSEFRTANMAKRQVFYNIFLRKYDHKDDPKLDDLRESLNNGSFCDPTQSKNPYTCRRDTDTVTYNSYKVRFHSDEDLNAGDIVVFFNNKATGEEGDVSSTDKKCAMVFVVNVTATPVDESEYDLSYGKCLKNAINCTSTKSPCPCVRKTKADTTAKPAASETTSETNSPKPTAQPTAQTTAQTTAQITSTVNPPIEGTTVAPPENSGRKGADSSSKTSFGEGILVGVFIGIVIAIVVMLLLCFFLYKKKGKPTFTRGEAVITKSSNEASATVKTDPSEEKTAVLSDDMDDKSGNIPNGIETDRKQSNGFPNKAYEPQTPTAPPLEEHHYETPLNPSPHACNGRLPSVDGGEQGRDSEKKNQFHKIVT